MGLFDRVKNALEAGYVSWQGKGASDAEQLASMTLPELESRATGIPLRAPGAKADEIVGMAPMNDKNPVVLGVNMTPLAVTDALQQATRGNMHRFCDLLSEQRSKVTHMHSVLSTREESVSGCKWLVVPKNMGDRKRASGQAKKIADDIDQCLRGVPDFNDAIKHLVGGNYFGRSALETVLYRDESGIGVEALHPIHPRRLSYASGWDLRLYDASGNEFNPLLARWPGIDIVREYPDKFIVYEAKTTGCEYPTRQGLGYQLVWACLFWIWTTRDWMQFAELHGRPWRVGMFAKDAGNIDIEALKRAVRELVGASSATLPAGAEVKLLTPGNAGTTHKDLRSMWNSEISKVVLGQTGTTELNDVGSYAATKVMELVRSDIKQSDGRRASEVLTRGLVKVLTRHRHGEQAARDLCPSLQIITQADEAIDLEFKRFVELADRKVKFDADEVRERFTRLSKPEDGAEIVEPKGGAPAPREDATAEDDKADPKAPKKPAADDIEDDQADAAE